MSPCLIQVVFAVEFQVCGFRLVVEVFVACGFCVMV